MATPKFAPNGEAVLTGSGVVPASILGGTFHALPFLIGDVTTALAVAYVVVACELVAIALVRKHFMQVALRVSLVQVTLGGAMVSVVGVVVGHA